MEQQVKGENSNIKNKRFLSLFENIFKEKCEKDDKVEKW